MNGQGLQLRVKGQKVRAKDYGLRIEDEKGKEAKYLCALFQLFAQVFKLLLWL